MGLCWRPDGQHASRSQRRLKSRWMGGVVGRRQSNPRRDDRGLAAGLKATFTAHCLGCRRVAPRSAADVEGLSVLVVMPYVRAVAKSLAPVVSATELEPVADGVLTRIARGNDLDASRVPCIGFVRVPSETSQRGREIVTVPVVKPVAPRLEPAAASTSSPPSPMLRSKFEGDGAVLTPPSGRSAQLKRTQR
jgi:hypothetical protein